MVIHIPPGMSFMDSSKKVLADDVKCATLTDFCPSNLAQHVRLHYGRLDTYAKLREEIFTYIQAQPESQGGPSPTDRARRPR